MMRRTLGALLALATMTADATAQGRGTAPALPPAVAREIETIHDAAETARRDGPVTVAADEVLGPLVVRGGGVTVAGTVRGMLVGLNADVTLLPGARVEGGVLVVGGRVDGRLEARITGDVRVYAEAVRYRLEGERLVIEGAAAPDEDRDFWRRGGLGDRSRFDLLSVATASTYNRVEGLPVLIGPRLRVDRAWGELTLEARGIVRTADPIRWDRGTLGHTARVSLRRGATRGLGVELRHYDEVAAVEDWQMSASESGFASFVLRRDFRDHYGRHGGGGTLRGYLSDDVSLALTAVQERWASRPTRDAWTLLRSEDPWRDNPTMDEGVARLLTARVDLDTRTQRDSPWAGWYLRAELERGTLDGTAAGWRGPGAWPALPTDASATWTRGLVDLRRYNRLGPDVQVNLRAVYGGWLGGDPLPLQRRLSVGGPATLPGFDFRRHWRGGEDRLQCSGDAGGAPGMPALCDRVALAQLELRGPTLFDVAAFDHHWIPAEISGPTWFLFANAGRGWTARPEAGATRAAVSFPGFDTFKTDIGLGLDFGSISVAVAKAVSDASEPANVIVRLERRF